jgi:trimethylamine--corrinoid protein Co-methyltransferase
MINKGFKRSFKPLEILTEEQVERINRGTLKILRDTGVTFNSEKALKMFSKNGCNVDFENKRVRFPTEVIEKCVRMCPAIFNCKARDPSNDLQIGGDTVYFTPFSGMQTVDLDTWEPRLPTRKEYYDFIKVLDALDNLHWLWGYPYFGFEGLPPVMRIPESVAGKIRNSTKFQLVANNKEADIFAINMAKAIGVEIMGVVAISPPLTYYEDQIESAFRCVEADFPILIASGCIYGSTAPATIAGATVTTNAELLAGIALIQLKKPGARVLVQDFTFPQNMRTGLPAFGDIGSSLHHAVFNQIWRKYDLPINNASIGNSKLPDFQICYEKIIPCLIDALSGAHVTLLHGGVSAEITAHPVLAVLDDDVAGMIGRFIEGVELNDETLAIDLISDVGPIPGIFLNKEHTRKWWEKEQYITKAADRQSYDEWKRFGKKNALDYAKEIMEEIIATHRPDPLTENQEKDIEMILEDARKYYRKKGMM